LAHVDSTTSQHTIRQGFDVAVTIWNAFVMDRVNGNSTYQPLMQERGSALGHDNPLIKALVERRLKLFSEDMRIVAEHRVSFDAKGYRLWAAARTLMPRQRSDEIDSRHHRVSKVE
jgi:hypothetical protein